MKITTATQQPMADEQQKTVGIPYLANPRMVCRDVQVWYGKDKNKKHAVKDVSIDVGNK
jgi:phosphate transport system ATP-binding protein